MTTPILFCHGTYGRGARWHREGSPLWAAFVARGFTPLTFLWSGALAGVPTKLAADPFTPYADGKLLPWCSAGEKLRMFCQLHGLERPHVVSHSHGLQVVAFAAASGQRFATALSISGPPRLDMAPVRAIARPNIGRWIQTFDPDPASDPTIHEGMLFDGGVSLSLELPEGDLSLPVPEHGHSGLLERITTWTAMKLFDYFTAAPLLEAGVSFGTAAA